MSKHLERDLDALEREILAQSSLVEEMIRKASRALSERQIDIVSELISREEEINLREVQIEEECLKILALHQPVAVDLRRAATILKINGDLERIADLAMNVAERVETISEFPGCDTPPNLEEMTQKSMQMVRDSLDAFVDQDVELARDVCRRDDAVDDLNREVIHSLYELMKSDPSMVEVGLQFFSASRHIERIADHATNIAEDVIYLVEGEIARHHPREKHTGLSST